MEYCWTENDGVQSNYSERNLTKYHFFTVIPTWNALRMNSVLRCMKPATKRHITYRFGLLSTRQKPFV